MHHKGFISSFVKVCESLAEGEIFSCITQREARDNKTLCCASSPKVERYMGKKSAMQIAFDEDLCRNLRQKTKPVSQMQVGC